MFKITIEETKTVRRTVADAWGIIGTREVEREQRFYSTDEQGSKTRIDEVRGYLPPIEKDVEIKSTILTHEVETLDLAAVIKAINKL